ncbi:uncharacterized protein F5891DRAFT_941921, partial [Suillus fuscotomentosus]
TLWHAILAFEELKMAWEQKCNVPKCELYQVALQKGLDKVNKYYQKMDKKHVYVLALVLHPYYKLEYIKMTWGGHEEQEHECTAGNLNAKDWHDEALKVVETTMEDYWKTCPSTTHPLVTASVASTSTTPSHNMTTVESAFDRHCHLLLEQATLDHDAGWAAELQRYLKDMPNVSKSIDIIDWWSVSVLTLIFVYSTNYFI